MGEIIHRVHPTGDNRVIDARKLFIEKYTEGIFRRLEKEIRLLYKWFRDNYPQGRLEVQVEFSKIRRIVYIRTRVFQDKEPVNDRDSFIKLMTIEEKSLGNPKFMDTYLMIFNEKFREELTRLLRNHEHKKLVLLSE